MAQQPMLFEDSLHNNLSMYQKLSDKEMISALKMVNLTSFADTAGLDSLIKEGGKNLSGGERRRICLARSLLRKTPVLILDEPLAEVDPDSVRMIEDLIISLRGVTLFVISHQVSPRFEAAFDLHIQVG